MPDDRGPPDAPFPTTRLSAVAELASDDPAVRARSFGTLVLGYYKPVYKHVRFKWRKSAAEAEVLTEDFFGTAFAKRFFKGYDPAHARFRTYVRMCVDRFVAKERRRDASAKRGGGKAPINLDFGGAEDEIAALGPPAESEIDGYFDREWARHVFGMALDGLRAHCEAKGQAIRYRVFERYEIAGRAGEQPSYAEVARELGIPETAVTNHLHAARKKLRELVKDALRALTPNEEEYRSEVRALLGAGALEDEPKGRGKGS